VTVNRKEENSSLCPNYVPEFGLWGGGGGRREFSVQINNFYLSFITRLVSYRCFHKVFHTANYWKLRMNLYSRYFSIWVYQLPTGWGLRISFICPTVILRKLVVIGFDHKVRTYKEYHSVCPSSELGLPPNPHPQAGVPPPPCFWGEGNTRWRERGWVGESQFRRGAYTMVLFICTYLWVWPYNKLRTRKQV
jgi:hypothetical protein